jgi:tripeptide aminopeptidase
VLLHTIEQLLAQRRPHPPLTFLWSVQEEVGLQGARNIRQSWLGNPRMGFNFDGGSPAKLTVGATGGYRMDIEVNGIASHAGGAPEQGVSAIAIASLAIADLQRRGWHGDVHKARRHGTSNVGYILGGEATNVVTDRVAIRAEARSHDPTFRDRIVSEIERAFQRAASEVRNCDGKCGSVKFQGRLDYEAFLLDRSEPCVALAEAAVGRVGRKAELAVTNGGLDANWLVSYGIPTVSLGCGQRNQHMAGEALDIADFLDACRIALILATDAES